MRTKKRQKGFSLLEVVIAALVLSIGLLGHSKIQALGVRTATDAHLRTQATYLLDEMVERLRANRPAADTDYYASINYAAINCANAPARICSDGDGVSALQCNASEIADEDSIHWFCDVQNKLPSGNVKVSVAASVYSVQVSWIGKDEDGNNQSRNVSATIIP